jgi:hypothetical protein
VNIFVIFPQLNGDGETLKNIQKNLRIFSNSYIFLYILCMFYRKGSSSVTWQGNWEE